VYSKLTIKVRNTLLSKSIQPGYSLSPENPKVTFLYHCDFYVPIGTKYNPKPNKSNTLKNED
jgi:hypothetical protein